MEDKALKQKHRSKLLLGFFKQMSRQDAKPSIKYLEVTPVILSYDEEEGKYLPLKKCVSNNKWNGMNLKNVAHRLQTVPHNSFNSKISVSKEGKYRLSMRGKQVLNRKKQSRLK